MMPTDTSIYNAFLAPPKSAMDYQNEFLGAQVQRQRVQQNAIGLQGAQASLADAQRVRDEQAGVRSALAGLPPTSTPDDQVKALRSLGTPTALTTADTLATSYGNQQVAAATAKEKTSIGAKNDNDTAIAKHQQRLQALATVQSPEDAVQWALDGVKSGDMPQESLPIVLQKIGAASQAPGGLDQWKQNLAQAGQSIQQQREMAAPKPTEVRLGNVVKMIDTNAYSPTYGKEVVAPQPIGVSPDTVATQAGENARSAAGIQKDYKINGLDASGNFSAPVAPAAAPGEPAGAAPVAGKLPPLIQSYVDSIGKYQTGEGTALQRLPPGIKSQVLAGLQDQYPGYNPADFAGINKTIGSMANGPLGNMTRSINVVQTHLDVMGKLVDAMSNGDTQIVNKARNFYQQQTGQTAPTNLTAAKQLVMGEVANVVASGAAGVSDRATAQEALDNASSPEQFKGVLNSVIKPLMAGKLQGLEQQYQAGSMGRKDYRTKYLGPEARASLEAVSPGDSAGGAVPPDIQAILAKHGSK